MMEQCKLWVKKCYSWIKTLIVKLLPGIIAALVAIGFLAPADGSTIKDRVDYVIELLDGVLDTETEDEVDDSSIEVEQVATGDVAWSLDV